MTLYGLEGRIFAERIERLRGLRWLVAKLHHRPTRYRIIERVDVTGCSVVKRLP